VSKLLVIRQITAEMPKGDPDESTGGDRQHYRANKQKPEKFNHSSSV
jgi:hypothetical protein